MLSHMVFSAMPPINPLFSPHSWTFLHILTFSQIIPCWSDRSWKLSLPLLPIIPPFVFCLLVSFAAAVTICIFFFLSLWSVFTQISDNCEEMFWKHKNLHNGWFSELELQRVITFVCFHQHEVINLFHDFHYHLLNINAYKLLSWHFIAYMLYNDS